MDYKAMLIQSLINNIGTPLMVAIGTVLCVLVKHFLEKLSNTIIARNELHEAEKKSTIRKDIIDTISSAVDSAVAANMQLADSMKEAGHKLTDTEITTLKTNAKQMVLNSLPTSITSADGKLMEYIGGPDKLNAIIDTLNEKSVYEYKLKKAAMEPQVVKEEVVKEVPINADMIPVRRLRQ